MTDGIAIVVSGQLTNGLCDVILRHDLGNISQLINRNHSVRRRNCPVIVMFVELLDVYFHTPTLVVMILFTDKRIFSS